MNRGGGQEGPENRHFIDRKFLSPFVSSPPTPFALLKFESFNSRFIFEYSIH